MMGSLRRISRLLLIVGLIPAIIAAGLPTPLCACDAAPATSGCACCESHQTSCCEDVEAGCPCCEKAASASCHDQQDDQNSGPALACHCGGPAPVPAAPAPSPVELTLDAGLSTASLDAIVPVPVVPRAAKRDRSALLPSADFPTTLCTLLI